MSVCGLLMTDSESDSSDLSDSDVDSDVDYSYTLTKISENDARFVDTKEIVFEDIKNIKGRLQESLNHYSNLESWEKNSNQKLAPIEGKTFILVLIVERNNEILLISDIMIMTPLYKTFYRNLAVGFILGKHEHSNENCNENCKWTMQKEGTLDVYTFSYDDIKTYWRIE